VWGVKDFFSLLHHASCGIAATAALIGTASQTDALLFSYLLVAGIGIYLLVAFLFSLAAVFAVSSPAVHAGFLACASGSLHAGNSIALPL
jgi:hypothetical protein